MIDENEFRKRSDEALTVLQRALEKASDTHDFEVDRNQGALTVEFDERPNKSSPAKFVVSPNAPVRQIWVSARVQSFKLDWNADAAGFGLPDGRDLHRLLADLVSEQLGERVSLGQ